MEQGGSAGAYPGAGLRVHDLLARHRNVRPDVEAAVGDTVRLTYSQLSEHVDAIARGLIAAGVERGDRVATLAPPSLDFWLTYLAATSIGAIWLGLNPRYQAPEYAYLLNDAEPKVVFARSFYDDRHYLAELQALGAPGARFVELSDPAVRHSPIEGLIAAGDRVDDDTLDRRRAEVDPEDVAVIVYTSGTTGKPKGAMLSHRAIMAAACINQAWMGVDLASTICAAPINHVGALNNVCMNVFASGGKIAFHHRVDVAEIARLAEREQPTYLVASPTTFVMFAQNPDAGIAAMGRYSLLVFGGGTTPEALLKPVAQTGIRMFNVFGQTETVGIVTATEEGASTAVMATTIGKPLPHCALRIVRTDGSIAEDDESGEIQVAGPLIMSGYFRRDEATREAITADGWLRTGDLGTRRPDGNFTFVGRLKEMYKSGGYNIYPVEIEQALSEHPAVAAAAVLPVPHTLFQEVGHAFVMTAAGAEVDADTLRGFLRERLANYKVPKTFSIESELPLLPNSKIDKQALKRRLEREGAPV